MDRRGVIFAGVEDDGRVFKKTIAGCRAVATARSRCPSRFISPTAIAVAPIPETGLGAAILDRLRRTYCRNVGVEFTHVQDPGRKIWLQRQLEEQNKLLEERFDIHLGFTMADY